MCEEVLALERRPDTKQLKYADLLKKARANIAKRNIRDPRKATEAIKSGRKYEEEDELCLNDDVLLQARLKKDGLKHPNTEAVLNEDV